MNEQEYIPLLQKLNMLSPSHDFIIPLKAAKPPLKKCQDTSQKSQYRHKSERHAANV
jgi:hypothetical protein